MEKRKNIIFILSDQHRFCDTGYMGNKTVETPNLDEMAANGANFTNTYSVCPLCVPARGSIFTGLHALKHKAAANDMPVDTTALSMGKIFKNEGYQTAYIGKWHMGGVPREKFIEENDRLGFDFWRGCNCNHEYLNAYYDDNENVRHTIDGYEPVVQTDLAIDFLNKNSDNPNPFILSLCFGPPHNPYFQLPEGEKERFISKKFALRKNAVLRKKHDFAVKFQPLHKLYAGYYAQISQLDKQIGRILDWLKTSGHIKDTILIYTSDHGDMLGSHGFANKQLWYEESAKVPCLFYSPGFIPAGERRQLLSLLDLTPTLAGLCGISVKNTDGRDQSACVTDKTKKGQEYVYFYSYVPCHEASMRKVKSWRAITDGTYKLVTDEKRKVVAFYNILSDPYEIKNEKRNRRLAKEQARLLKALDANVCKYDGYLPYEDLLNNAGILDKWLESERHFTTIWTFIPKPLRKLKMKLLEKTEKKYNLK